jgi:hypothetical protein
VNRELTELDETEIVAVVHTDGSQELYGPVDSFYLDEQGDLHLDDMRAGTVACYPKGGFLRAYRVAYEVVELDLEEETPDSEDLQ